MKVNDEKFLLFLYESTFQILGSYGSKGWTMDDICKSSGISKDTLYRAVSNKEDLILKSIKFEISIHIENIKALMDSELEYFSALNKVLSVLYEMLEKFSSKQLQSVLRDYPISSRYADAEFSELISLIENFLQKGIESKILRYDLNTMFIARNIHHTILYIIEKEDPKNYENYISNYFDILLNGIKSKNSLKEAICPESTYPKKQTIL